MSLCYSTDKATHYEIKRTKKANSPKYRPTTRQSYDREVKHCMLDVVRARTLEDKETK